MLSHLSPSGLLIARDYPLVEMMCQVYSNRGDKLKGRQLPIMYSDRAAGFFHHFRKSRDPIAASGGVGDGFAIKGDSRIAAAWVGEGRAPKAISQRHDLFRSLWRAGHPQSGQ